MVMSCPKKQFFQARLSSCGRERAERGNHYWEPRSASQDILPHTLPPSWTPPSLKLHVVRALTH